MVKFFTRLFTRFLPDAYVFSLILTLVVLLLGVTVSGSSLGLMIQYWGDGFWDLLTFSMQMALVLVFGFTLAKTPIVCKGLESIASIIKTHTQGVVLVSVVSLLSCYINWGFGLIVSALFALEVSKKLKKVNFALMIASAYSGFLVWHGGLSGSIPLKLTNPSLEIQKYVGKGIDLNETLYSSLNLTLLMLTVIILLTMNAWFSRDTSKIKNFDYSYIKPREQLEESSDFKNKIERSTFLSLIICSMGAFYIANHLFRGGSFNLNLMIFLFMIMGIGFSYNAQNFLHYFNHSIKDCSGILLQFPFYAGIMGMMKSSGMATELSTFFVSISNENTFMFFTYLSAGIVNFFVPSGGGQWAIQGPIILPAAKELGVSLSDAAMAIAWGDAWTNMVQPFWALPLLSVGKIKLHLIMGYCVLYFLIIGVITSGILLLF
jgi:short-chain fatty acids transporter